MSGICYFFLRITQIVIPHARIAAGIRMTNRMVRRTAVRVAMVMVVLSMDLDGMEIVVVSEVTALIEPLKSDRLDPDTIWFALSLKINGDVYTTAVEVTVPVLLSEEELLLTLSDAEELPDTESDPEEEALSAVLPSELLIVFTAFTPTILAASWSLSVCSISDSFLTLLCTYALSEVLRSGVYATCVLELS